MRLVVVASLLTLVLAGCIQTPAATPEKVVPAAALVGVVDVKLPAPLAGEPSFAVAPDGKTLYVAAIAGADDVTALWRSDDAGDSWMYVGPVASIYGSNDADIAVRADGSVWVATMWVRPLSPKCTTVSVSHDKGKTWMDDPFGCGASPYYDERPWLLADKDATYLSHYQSAVLSIPFVAYSTLVEEPPALAVSKDNVVWENHPMSGIPAGTSISPPVMHGSSISLLAFSGDTYQTRVGPSVGESTDQGASWKLTQVAKDTLAGRNPSLAYANDSGIMAWVATDGKGTRMRFASLSADGKWSAPWSPEPNGTSAMPWADSNAGHLAVAWLWTNESNHPTAVANQSEWRIHVWEDGKIIELPRVVHRGPLCSTYTNCPASGRGLGDFFSARVLADGRVAVAIPDDATDGGKPMMAPMRVMIAPAP